jgi:sulfoxide reductase heme-binding subunit YedZ
VAGAALPLGWIKAALFAVSLVPFLRLFVLGFQDRLGANPIEFVTRSTGWWALTFLCITLAVTPLRRLTGWQALIRLRRMLGLFAFFYASVHFVTYVWFDQWFSVPDIVADVWKRPFITVGFTAFVLLIPLAVTSTNRMMRRLGRRWSQLHRLVYAIVLLGLLHFWWIKGGKNDLAEPTLFAGIVAVLLAARLVPWWRRRAAGDQSRSRDSGRSKSAIVSRSRTG